MIRYTLSRVRGIASGFCSDHVCLVLAQGDILVTVGWEHVRIMEGMAASPWEGAVVSRLAAGPGRLGSRPCAAVTSSVGEWVLGLCAEIGGCGLWDSCVLFLWHSSGHTHSPLFVNLRGLNIMHCGYKALSIKASQLCSLNPLYSHAAFPFSFVTFNM